MWLRDSKTIFSEPWWVQEVLPDDDEDDEDDEEDLTDVTLVSDATY